MTSPDHRGPPRRHLAACAWPDALALQRRVRLLSPRARPLLPASRGSGQSATCASPASSSLPLLGPAPPAFGLCPPAARWLRAGSRPPRRPPLPRSGLCPAAAPRRPLHGSASSPAAASPSAPLHPRPPVRGSASLLAGKVPPRSATPPRRLTAAGCVSTPAVSGWPPRAGRLRHPAPPRPAPAGSSPAVWPRSADYAPSGRARPPLRAPTAYRLPRGFPHPAPDPSFRPPAGFGQAGCSFRSGSPSTCRLAAYGREAGPRSFRAAPDPAAPARPRLRPAASLRPRLRPRRADSARQCVRGPASALPMWLRAPAAPPRPSRPASPQPPCGLAPTTPRRLRPCPGLPRRLPGRGASAGRPAPPWPAPASRRLGRLAAPADIHARGRHAAPAGVRVPVHLPPPASRRLAPSQGRLPKKRKKKQGRVEKSKGRVPRKKWRE
nr:translation initiation factor IF-2-like [Aegilops tauschii subsp. strangulata]